MLCFNIHAAILKISRYAIKKMLLTVRQYDTSKSAVFVSFFFFCVRIQIRIGLGESLIH